MLFFQSAKAVVVFGILALCSLFPAVALAADSTIRVTPLVSAAGSQFDVEKLLAPGKGVGGAETYQGESMAIAGDRLIVGATGLLNSGGAIVYKRDSGDWVFEAALEPIEPWLYAYAGHEVLIDGNYAVLQARVPMTDGVQRWYKDSVHVFERRGTQWEHMQVLRAGQEGWGSEIFEVGLGSGSVLIAEPWEGLIHVYSLQDDAWTEIDQLHAPGTQDPAGFGTSLSVDGDRLIVGWPDEDREEPNMGAVYEYARSGSTWTLERRISGADPKAGNTFGWNVKIHEDLLVVVSHGSGVHVLEWTGSLWVDLGQLYSLDSTSSSSSFGEVIAVSDNRIAIGDPFADHLGTADGGSLFRENAGELSIFRRDGNQWLPDRYLTLDDPQREDRFGSSLAFDGADLLVGATGIHQIDNYSGGVILYENDTGDWVPGGDVTLDGNAWDWFGAAVLLDGKRAIIGSRFDKTADGNDSGSAYVYERERSGWFLKQRLEASDSSSAAYFGSTLDSSGNWLLVGADGHYDPEAVGGAAYLFEYVEPAYVQRKKLVPTDHEEVRKFGRTVALDGRYALVGARNRRFADAHSGAVYFFQLSEGQWVQRQKIVAEPSGAESEFGLKILLQADEALVGSYVVNADGDRFGRIHVFVFDGSLWQETQVLGSPVGIGGNRFGGEFARNGDELFVSDIRNDGTYDSVGEVYRYTLSGGMWQFDSAFTGADSVAKDQFGYSIALNDRMLAISAAAAHTNTLGNQGAVYLYRLIDGQWEGASKITAFDAQPSDRFGSRVALSGEQLAITALYDDDRGTASGSVYMHTLNMFKNGFE